MLVGGKIGIGFGRMVILGGPGARTKGTPGVRWRAGSDSELGETTGLRSPIDAMYLIHGALTAEAREAERLVYDTKIGAGVQPFRAIFNEWASVLAFHALM